MRPRRDVEELARATRYPPARLEKPYEESFRDTVRRMTPFDRYERKHIKVLL
jgi:hypothetical protein